MNKTIKIKRGLKSDLTLAGVVVGEPKFTTDTKELFIGDGTNNVQVGGDVLALPMSTATKTYVDSQDLTKADKLVLTNLVANGDFLIAKPSPNENEPLGFAYSNATDISLIDGVFSFTPTKRGGGFLKDNTGTSVIGNKYYYFAYVKTSVPNVNLTSYQPYTTTTHNGNGTWQFLSHVNTKNGTSDVVRIETNNDSVFGEIQVDYMGAINLTATFGAGNEPTKEQMDAIIKLKGYFDTTTIDIKDLMLLGFTQETRMTPTLTNATTTYLTYRKDDLGYVDIVGDLTITAFGTNFTLPEGYRPLTQLRLPILTSTNTLGYIIINTNGTVVSNANATIYINSRFATI